MANTTTAAAYNNPPPSINQGQQIQQNYSHAFQPLQFKAFKPPDGDYDGKRLRKTIMRKTVDYNSSVIQMLEGRVWQRDERDRPSLPADVCYASHLLPPPAYLSNPINSVVSKFVRSSTNKAKCPIFCLAWTPEGRRLITGASSGEFTLWNGLTFNFETILQAHDSSVRAMVWSNNDQWMVTGDTSGIVKYWQSNMNNVKMFQAHADPVRGLSFSPSDLKLASGSDDGTVRIWDFYTCREEKVLIGHGSDVKCVAWHPSKSLLASGSKDNQQPIKLESHGSDVKCVAWHPSKSLLASGSKDNQQPIKLWDPRSGQSLAQLHAHKSTVMDLKWNANGMWLCSASRDHLLKLFDIRNFNTELQVFRGHKKEASAIAWHPQHEGLLASGGSDGCVMFWHVGNDHEVGSIEAAHDGIIWGLAWHPLGHVLCSGSNDHSSKFWTRNRVGDRMRDKYNLNTLPPGVANDDCVDIDDIPADYPDWNNVIPGMGPEDRVEPEPIIEPMETIPGLEFDPVAFERMLKKTPYSKPIPKTFQASWNAAGNLEEPPHPDDVNTDWVINDPGNLFTKLAIHPKVKHVVTETGEHLPPGSVPIEELCADAIAYYGYYVPLPKMPVNKILDIFNFFDEDDAFEELTNDAEFTRKFLREKRGLFNPLQNKGLEDAKMKDFDRRCETRGPDFRDFKRDNRNSARDNRPSARDNRLPARDNRSLRRDRIDKNFSREWSRPKSVALKAENGGYRGDDRNFMEENRNFRGENRDFRGENRDFMEDDWDFREFRDGNSSARELRDGNRNAREFRDGNREARIFSDKFRGEMDNYDNGQNYGNELQGENKKDDPPSLLSLHFDDVGPFPSSNKQTFSGPQGDDFSNNRTNRFNEHGMYPDNDTEWDDSNYDNDDSNYCENNEEFQGGQQVNMGPRRGGREARRDRGGFNNDNTWNSRTGSSGLLGDEPSLEQGLLGNRPPANHHVARNNTEENDSFRNSPVSSGIQRRLDKSVGDRGRRRGGRNRGQGRGGEQRGGSRRNEW